MHTRLAAACLFVLACAPAWSADTPAPLQLEWDARARHEQVDNDAFARDARADTLRLRLGLRAQFGAGFSGYLEGAGVAAAGDHYNSGANGQTAYPAITDPKGGELDQAWLAWQGGHGVGVTAGRQRLLFDNQRWVGNVGWRQHEQTFDALALQWVPSADWTLRYAWLGRVHRVAGRDALSPSARERRLDTHLLNAAFRHGLQQWSGYAYLHEDRDVASASSATWGARWTGKPAADGPGWTLEVARQVDYGNNPDHFAHGYWLAEPAWTLRGITGRLGWEHLGGNGRHALQTPLATLHAFNGWDDQFTVTPAGGLEDRYAAVNGAFGPQARFGWSLAWHDFHAGHGSRYGSEWDGSLGYAVSPALNGTLKLASYRADGFGRDDMKLWLQVEWKGVRVLR